MRPGHGDERRFGRAAWRGAAGRAAGVMVMVLMLIGLLLLWPIAADPQATTRELVLVTRDMAFYAEGQETPNPVLTVRAGERVRVVLRNEDRGIEHNFEVRAWDQLVPTPRRGQTVTALIDVPPRPGRYEYVCGPHAAMMRGIIEVVAAD